MDACLQNFGAVFDLLIKSHVWERLMKLPINPNLGGGGRNPPVGVTLITQKH